MGNVKEKWNKVKEKIEVKRLKKGIAKGGKNKGKKVHDGVIFGIFREGKDIIVMRRAGEEKYGPMHRPLTII